MNIEPELHEGVRVCLVDSEVATWGVIQSVDEESHTVSVLWDNGRTSDVDADEVIPKGGW